MSTGVSVYHLDRSPHNHTVRSPWALKKVNRQHEASQFQDRLASEAKILQELKHPNIVGFRGFSKTDDGRQVLAMEVCNESLGNLIEESAENGETRFQPDKILTVIAGIAKGLQYLHEEKELLHGDIKSHNVLIKGNFEEIKLCDFGVSLPLRTASVEDYVGTGAWSAPETLDEGPLTDRADIFSLGLVIWEMLTLRTPNVDVSESVSFSDSFDSINIGQHYEEAIRQYIPYLGLDKRSSTPNKCPGSVEKRREEGSAPWFGKAFYCLGHNLILNALGVTETALKWTEIYLEDGSQVVKLKSTVKVTTKKFQSQPQSTQRGVPQGFMLGAVLFILFTNDLSEYRRETPELPGDLTSDYNLVVDIYQWCTQQLYTRRPTARDILDKLREAGIPLNMSPPQVTL
ncbi:hypothetical protein J6590_074770 [Homalodisca vitripennis]|nr:hypothetical protein J6590_074770 [Homalodisca vitripennis]